MTNPNSLREITRVIVSAHVFSSDGKILMGKKDPTKGGVYTDCWHIPGGGVDEGETKVDTLKREVLEETGIDISNAEIKLVDNEGRGATEKLLKDTDEKVWCNMEFNVYEVQINKSSDMVELTLNDDLVELRWFEMSELKKLALTPPSKVLFTKLGWI